VLFILSLLSFLQKGLCEEGQRGNERRGKEQKSSGLKMLLQFLDKSDKTLKSWYLNTLTQEGCTTKKQKLICLKVFVLSSTSSLVKWAEPDTPVFMATPILFL
jgi:hypothetical protein